MKDLAIILPGKISGLSGRKKIVLKIAVFLSAGLAAVYFLLTIYVAVYTLPLPETTADTAIVLGAKSYKGNYYNPCLISRVKTAVIAYQDGQINRIIMTGGNDVEDGINEAETMQKIAAEHGISTQDIILEKQATSTYENLLYSKKIMDDNGFNSAVIVSEPFHFARAGLIARSLGINASFRAADDSPCWTRWKYLSRYFLKEPLAILYYVFTGKISPTAW